MDEGRCAEEAAINPAVADWFFPVRGEASNVDEAKALCNGWADGSVTPCPVRSECLEYAIVHIEKYGVWGGKTERERRRIRVQRAEERLRGKAGS